MKNKILSRRSFVQSMTFIGSSIPFILWTDSLAASDKKLTYKTYTGFQSNFLKVELSKDHPGFRFLSVDSLGKKKLNLNPVRVISTKKKYFVRETEGRTEYRLSEKSSPCWIIEITSKSINLQSNYSGNENIEPILVNFNPKICHATLLGLMKKDDQRVILPALLHLPDMGSFKITSAQSNKISLGYNTSKVAKEPFAEISFPPATADNPRVEYKLEVVSVYPKIDGIENDSRFDGFRRNYLNIFQLNPYYKALANHTASGVVAFIVYEYAKVALHAPPLANGLSSLDILGQTLDQYLGGMLGYGMIGYKDSMPGEHGDPQTHETLDTYPSLLIASAYYFKGTKNKKWLEKNYSKLEAWAKKMLDLDIDQDGLIESSLSGNANSYNDPSMRTSNWWDVVGFGYKDAYANIIAYHALLEFAELSKQMGKIEEEKFYLNRSKKLYDKFYATFYNPSPGVLGGWVSKDGTLHDYYFTFVNSMAIFYDLVSLDKAKDIMDKLMSKMREVGYNNFELGLPGNLIPIRKEDYVAVGKRWGAPDKEDGSDAFQTYENGGATACYAYYTIEALYKLNRNDEADKILFSMLKSYEDGKFQGVGSNGMTNDWKKWDGTPDGYEGLLAEGYLALLSVLTMKGKE